MEESMMNGTGCMTDRHCSKIYDRASTTAMGG